MINNRHNADFCVVDGPLMKGRNIQGYTDCGG
jgi:hypothetical protein